jgi:hypothetical protein
MKKSVIAIALVMSLISCGGSNETSTEVSTYDSARVDSSVTATDSTVSKIEDETPVVNVK